MQRRHWKIAPPMVISLPTPSHIGPTISFNKMDLWVIWMLLRLFLGLACNFTVDSIYQGLCIRLWYKLGMGRSVSFTLSVLICLKHWVLLFPNLNLQMFENSTMSIILSRWLHWPIICIELKQGAPLIFHSKWQFLLFTGGERPLHTTAKCKWHFSNTF